MTLTVSVFSPCLCPQSVSDHGQSEDSRRSSGGHRPVGHHYHDHEECPEEPFVVAWLDACAPRLSVHHYPAVDGETMNVFICAALGRVTHVLVSHITWGTLAQL